MSTITMDLTSALQRCGVRSAVCCRLPSIHGLLCIDLRPWTFIDFHLTFVWSWSNFCSTFVWFSSDVCPTFVHRSFNAHSTFIQFPPFGPFHPSTSVHRCSYPSTHRILQTICCVRTLWLMLCIATKFWGMGQHHVFEWWEHCWSTRAKVSATK
jgi:hypothetical protein